MEDAKKKYADKKDILDPVQRIIGRNLIKLVKCTNCIINLSDFIIMNDNPNERIHIWFEDCQNVTVLVPADYERYVYDNSISYTDSQNKNVEKYFTTSNNNNVVYFNNKTECYIDDLKYQLMHEPHYNSYIISTNYRKEIDLSTLPLQQIGTTINIKVRNNNPDTKDPSSQCTLKLEDGNIENASDIVINPNETYKFKLYCKKADDLIENETESNIKKNYKFKGEKAKWILSERV